MYRRGDNVSPKVDLFKKIILSPDNAKYFKVRRGNGMALNGSTKTTIEYDSIARDILEYKYGLLRLHYVLTKHTLLSKNVIN